MKLSISKYKSEKFLFSTLQLAIISHFYPTEMWENADIVICLYI